jgi:hypothetical protein
MLPLVELLPVNLPRSFRNVCCCATVGRPRQNLGRSEQEVVGRQRAGEVIECYLIGSRGDDGGPSLNQEAKVGE